MKYFYYLVSIMILTVIGARPQFVKAAVLSNEFKRVGIEELIVHTGQHYDYKMSEVFFEELQLPGIGINLNLGSGSHGKQTADMLQGIEKILIDHRNEVTHVLLFGDTNSTLAGALAAAKLNIPVIHVEAGLRSFNKHMPEEVNRILTDHVSELLFCSSEEGRKHLANEGIQKGVYVVGDIMLDAFNTYGKIANSKIKIEQILPPDIIDNYHLLTIHRPSNTDEEGNLSSILRALASVRGNIVWPLHPRVRSRISHVQVPHNVYLFDPFSYFEMMVVLCSAQKVITDSGGLQKEAYWAKKPCITVRYETEWVETLHDHWNQITGPDTNKIENAISSSVDSETWTQLYGDGNTACNISNIIRSIIG